MKKKKKTRLKTHTPSKTVKANVSHFFLKIYLFLSTQTLFSFQEFKSLSSCNSSWFRHSNLSRERYFPSWSSIAQIAQKTLLDLLHTFSLALSISRYCWTKLGPNSIAPYSLSSFWNSCCRILRRWWCPKPRESGPHRISDTFGAS